MYQAFLVKYAEIGIKGKNRYKFENALCQQMERTLKPLDGEFVVERQQGRIFVEAKGDFDEDDVIEALQHVFGISGICPVNVIEDKTWENVAKGVGDFVEQQYDKLDFTFKVESKRSDKHYPMTSPEVCVETGAYLLDRFPELRVDVHKPEVRIWVEIREKAYVYSKVIKGAGGMPLGTNGSAMLLLSGGIDSPVAGYMLAKRGVHISAIHYVSPPYTSDRARLKVEELCQKLTGYCGSISFFCVPFTEIQEAIRNHCPEEFFTIIMRRLMMKIAQKISKQEKCMALITGESVGQVASQTMNAIACTDAVCEMPVFRPLIGMDKTEIIEIARKIDTFETSIQPYEDCCTVFTPRHPKVKPFLSDVEKAEGNFDFTEMLDEAVKNTELKIFNVED